MAEMVLETQRLRLELQSPAETLRWIESLDAATKAEISPEYVARLISTEGADPWTCAFTMIDAQTNSVVGSCAFKGPPDAAGSVEIAYGVEEEYQGRGYATEAAQALVDFCRTNDAVRTVCAHTMPGISASTLVLQKVGFRFIGEVVDPEDGLVNRWELVLGPRSE